MLCRRFFVENGLRVQVPGQATAAASLTELAAGSIKRLAHLFSHSINQAVLFIRSTANFNAAEDRLLFEVVLHFPVHPPVAAPEYVHSSLAGARKADAALPDTSTQRSRNYPTAHWHDRARYLPSSIWRMGSAHPDEIDKHLIVIRQVQGQRPASHEVRSFVHDPKSHAPKK